MNDSCVLYYLIHDSLFMLFILSGKKSQSISSRVCDDQRSKHFTSIDKVYQRISYYINPVHAADCGH